MKAIVARDQRGVHRIVAQRAKYKHWFELGKHKETESAFYQALRHGRIEWGEEIKQTDSLFEK